MSVMNQQRPSSSQTSYVVSGLSFLIILSIACCIIEWHSNRVLTRNGTSLDSSFGYFHRHRKIVESTLNWRKKDSGNNDDETRDERCREYLVNFLNGTTDEKDECEGMKNAYEAADCEDSNSLLPFIQKHNHHHHNTTDDDVMIDDYFEAWRCCSSIYAHFTKHCQRPELASFKLLGIVSVLILCGLVMSLLKTFQVKWIPDAAACILVGATFGGVVGFVNPTSKFTFLIRNCV
jgi:ABC-type nickel/cobalt efflux system permease component RcnA